MKMFARIAVAALLLTGTFVTNVKAEETAKPKTIAETAIAAGQFNTLVAAVKAAGLVEALSGETPLTVFAPTDAAFGKLPKGTVESLLKPEALEQLQAILKYHVVAGKMPAEKVLQQDELKTLQGQALTIKMVDGAAMVNGAKIVKTDIMCSNGVIHVIDAVVLPPAAE